MNSDKIKGSVDNAVGRVKRQVGEWTGDTQSQVEGAARQVKGKTEKAVGSVRDALHNSGTGPGPDVEEERESEMDDNTNRETIQERETIRERK